MTPVATDGERDERVGTALNVLVEGIAADTEVRVELPAVVPNGNVDPEVDT